MWFVRIGALIVLHHQYIKRVLKRFVERWSHILYKWLDMIYVSFTRCYLQICQRRRALQQQRRQASKDSDAGSVVKAVVPSHFELEGLTWNLRIHPWKRNIIFQTIISRFYVNLPGCIPSQNCCYKYHSDLLGWMIFDMSWFLCCFGWSDSTAEPFFLGMWRMLGRTVSLMLIPLWIYMNILFVNSGG